MVFIIGVFGVFFIDVFSLSFDAFCIVVIGKFGIDVFDIDVFDVFVVMDVIVVIM